MNKPWKRKCRDEDNFRDFRNEDLFVCHTCKKYYPWFCFCKGCVFIFRGDGSCTYEYMNDNKDRGGRQWSCDRCIDKILHNNKIITIRDDSKKIIHFDNYLEN